MGNKHCDVREVNTMAILQKNLEFDTLKINGGYSSDAHARSVNVPIYQSAAFEFGDEARGERLFTNRELGFLYSRVGNPTVDALEQRIAALHGANAAISFASGMAAITNTLLQVGIGGSILTSYHLYGGTVDSFKKVYKDYGIRIDFSKNIYDPAKLEEDIKEDTKAIYVETVSNPTTDVADLEALADLAHKHNIPLIVDNTLLTPYLLNPIEYGADIVIYSATKNLSGHGNVVAGIVVEKGGFDWQNGKFPAFTEKYYTLRDVENGDVERSFPEVFPGFPFTARLRLVGLNFFGAKLSAFEAYLVILGLDTLSERIRKQQENLTDLVDFLKSNEHIAWVNYPTLEGNPNKQLAEKYLKKGAGNIFSFAVKGTTEQKNRFLDSLTLFHFHVNIGDVRSLIVNSPQTTHSELDGDERVKADLSENLIRVSVGLEDSKDLIEDLRTSLEQVFGS